MGIQLSSGYYDVDTSDYVALVNLIEELYQKKGGDYKEMQLLIGLAERAIQKIHRREAIDHVLDTIIDVAQQLKQKLH